MFTLTNQSLMQISSLTGVRIKIETQRMNNGYSTELASGVVDLKNGS